MEQILTRMKEYEGHITMATLPHKIICVTSLMCLCNVKTYNLGVVCWLAELAVEEKMHKVSYQILADKNPDEDSEEDAADEPEDSECIKLL